MASVSVTLDGALVISESEAEIGRMWDPATGRELTISEAMRKRVTRVT